MLPDEEEKSLNRSSKSPPNSGKNTKEVDVSSIDSGNHSDEVVAPILRLDPPGGGRVDPTDMDDLSIGHSQSAMVASSPVYSVPSVASLTSNSVPNEFLNTGGVNMFAPSPFINDDHDSGGAQRINEFDGPNSKTQYLGKRT